MHFVNIFFGYYGHIFPLLVGVEGSVGSLTILFLVQIMSQPDRSAGHQGDGPRHQDGQLGVGDCPWGDQDMVKIIVMMVLYCCMDKLVVMKMIKTKLNLLFLFST